MDKLPAMKRGLEFGKKEKVEPMKKMVGSLAPASYENSHVGAYGLGQLIIIAALFFLLGAIATLYGPFLAGRLAVRLHPQSKTFMWHHSSNL
jgi:hypothetical protein